MIVFTYIGIAVTVFAVWFVHEACKIIFRPYRRLCLNVWDWMSLPYLMTKIYRYSDSDLINVKRYTVAAKQRWPIIVMRWHVDRLCKSRGL